MANVFSVACGLHANCSTALARQNLYNVSILYSKSGATFIEESDLLGAQGGAGYHAEIRGVDDVDGYLSYF